MLGTTTQGLTNYVSVAAGNSDAGSLLLEVFDINNLLLASQSNISSGISTFGITRGLADIAYFRVSTPAGDTFGVDEVTIETPIATTTGVPEPASIAVFGLIGMMMAVCHLLSPRAVG